MGLPGVLMKSDYTAFSSLAETIAAIDVRRVEFRYNNRENPYMFRDAMLKLLLAENLTLPKLIED